jgi:hypothetical protein
LLKHAPAITFRHDEWRAPTVKTTDYFRCKESEETWPGHDTAPNTGARCTPAPHYEALLAEAARVGWPQEYRRDVLVHDRNHCARLDPATPFVWVLRTMGSHLFPIGVRDGVGHGAAHFAVSCPETFGTERCRVYTWDGSRLTEHRTPERAAEVAGELETRYLALGTGTGVCFRTPNDPNVAWYKHHTACASVTGIE